MRFSVSTAFLPVDHLRPLAEAAEELGYHRVAVPDHVVHLESPSTPYPYTVDGSRRWEHDAPWPDPFVLIGALAAATTRIGFFTGVYVAALRNPYVVAKAVGTAAVLSGNRVALGVGAGWSADEFELLEQPFAGRGRRLDEVLDLLAALWRPGWTEFEGEHYRTPRLTMEPTPTAPVPVLVGGISEAALARAARHDGWIGDLCPTDDAIAFAADLAERRAALGRTGPFDVVASLSDAFLPEHFARAEAGGVTEILTQPWVYYHRGEVTLDERLAAMVRFADEIVRPLAS